MLIPSVFATHINNNLLWDKTIVYLKDTAKDDGRTNVIINITGNPQNVTTSCAIGTGCMFFDGNDDGLKIDNKDGTLFGWVINRTFCFATNHSSPASGHVKYYDERAVGGANTEDLQFYDDTGEFRVNYNEEYGGPSSTLAIDGSNFPDGVWEQYCAGVWWNGDTLNVSICRNATHLTHTTSSHTEINGFINNARGLFYAFRDGIQFMKGGADNVWLGNITPDSEICEFFWNNGNFRELSAPVTTPPGIDFYNMTSEGGEGCTVWNINKATPCVTNDTTPTTFFNTSKNAFCAVGISNLNYTNLGISRNCTGGGGTKEHTCTLTPQDELTEENSFIYISCKDENGNENLTSTSGALALNIHAKETGGVQSIGIGVQNALLSGYTNYTSQQIYARDLNNNQFTGTFDWVVKKGTKVWALNYISSGESHVAGTFNLTPSLHVLQLTNTTQQQVTLLVEQMINATK